MKVKVKSWTMAAYWSWNDTNSDVCGICQVEFEGCCPECNMPGDDCPVLWGECSHAFHMHCIMKWLEKATGNPQCPLDRQLWKTATAPSQ
ncbi:anaphase-promoting complex subunit Apc11 [Phycomyces blakesleeanus]|uniref:Anaphase-promoting complex subunit 11 n=2 Tax=Phycomyces blakesleeanus TaxID=4837 RepID=A0A163AXL1_PHYB8|nr:hypothetical protein PHYBLDRAFT_110497 [Phycomyces blakesleeanus NRRL 1555(-)]OAD76471.1 hypothetical protein PHYBLDRAFT_110497 [Phycomyces blakesleeanus NRRL 1555(-)]|eukprot:XP_018294511.1 hypothetical protein PHYBLDRAFT_110497 [Phycomyces blakesleeanus NRRL 1555(-)]